jgi:hypothetical protein
MRLSSIIQPASLLENDDDMFPGVSSSVFDDAKAKDQPEHDMNDVNWVNSQVTKYSKAIRAYEDKRNIILNDMEENGAREYIGHGNYPPATDILYSEFDWFSNYYVLGLSNYHSIKKTSPYLKDIENTVRILDGYYKREEFFRYKNQMFVTARTNIEKQQRKGKK